MCARMDPVATLTSIESQAENDYVRSFVSSYAWIGGNDKNGDWRWVNLCIRQWWAKDPVMILRKNPKIIRLSRALTFTSNA